MPVFYKVEKIDRDHEALFEVDSETRASRRISGIFDEIHLSSDKQFFRATNGILESLFSVEEPQKPIVSNCRSLKYDGVMTGDSNYYQVMLQNFKKQVFQLRKKPISLQWYDLEAGGLLAGLSSYYAAQRKDKKWAIFHKDHLARPVSKWLDSVSWRGLLMGTSLFYLGTLKNKQILFKVGSKDPVSRPWKQVEATSLLRGLSSHYLAQNSRGLWNIFSLESTEPIGLWAHKYSSTGLVDGSSEYVACSKNDKSAIFNKKGEAISNWKDSIWPHGLVAGTSDYFLARNNGMLEICHVKDSREVIDVVLSLETSPEEVLESPLFTKRDSNLVILKSRKVPLPLLKFKKKRFKL